MTAYSATPARGGPGIQPARPPARRGLATRLRAAFRRAGLVIGALLHPACKPWYYRACFGFRIHPTARIGACYLDCTRLEVGEHALLANANVFLHCGEVSIGAHAHVGSLNLFSGGRTICLGPWSHVRRLNFVNAIRDHDCTNNPDSSFILGYGSVLTAEHRIDFTDRVEIGRCTVMGGRNSSIWSHNIRTGEPVSIGSYCYLGSEIRIAPGACIPDCCVVGLASVVTRGQTEPFSLIAGVPARRVRELTAEDREMIFGRTRPDLPEETYPVPAAWRDAE